MNCTTAQQEALAFRRGELDARQSGAIRAHLESCAACARAHDELARFDELMLRITPAPRPGFKDEVMAAVRASNGVPALAGEPRIHGRLHGGIADAQRTLTSWRAAASRGALALLDEHAWKVSISVVAHAALILISVMIGGGKGSIRHQDETMVQVAILEGRDLAMARADGDEERTAAGRPASESLVLGAGETSLHAGESGREPDEESGAAPDELTQVGSSEATAKAGADRPLLDREGLFSPENEEDLFARMKRPPTERPGENARLLSQRSDRKSRLDAMRTTGLEVATVVAVSEAIDRGLDWLAVNQQDDGSWDAAAHGGDADLAVAVTAMALLPFLAEGHASMGESHYSKTVVAPAIDWLLERQGKDGSYGAWIGQRGLFNHALATQALAEDLAMCVPLGAPDSRWRSAQRAVAFARSSQIAMIGTQGRKGEAAGGWGYTPASTVTDSNVSGWMVQALLSYEAAVSARGRSSANASLEIAYSGVREWLARYTDPATGILGYDGFRQSGNYGVVTLTAIGLLAGTISGMSMDSDLSRAQVGLISSTKPEAIGARIDETDYCRAYFIALALHIQAEHSEQSRRAFRAMFRHIASDLVALQIEDSGALTGAWPLDRWNSFGGRVYATAAAMLALETPYRFGAR